MIASDTAIRNFRRTVQAYYKRSGRQMPWRDQPTSYFVLVSELMLQQTQVARVLPKFGSFVQRFPSFEVLAAAPLSAVVAQWNGLGYNRRAKYLHETARQVCAEYGGRLPERLEELVRLPGIGPNTAGAIAAYAYNRPTIFIETNIRTVYFHHFFPDNAAVSDAELRPYIEATLDRRHPREWYWALMDYGTYLKQTRPNNIQKSTHYVRQSTFAGSNRQLRGQVLRLLIPGPVSYIKLAAAIADDRFPEILDKLITESLVRQNGQIISLA